MGLAYGAANSPGTGDYAQRIGVIIDPNGLVLDYHQSADVTGFPKQALALIAAA